MHGKSVAFVIAFSVLFSATTNADTVHRSEIRIRDPFVLPDPASQTYFIYSSTDWGSEAEQHRKAVIVYRSKDLENWESPTAGVRGAGRALGP
jgi:hypothetical protein